MPRVQLHGHTVIYEDDDRPGYEYLARKIQYQEADVLFDYAKEHGAAQFETQSKEDYSLIRNSDGTYKIAKR